MTHQKRNVPRTVPQWRNPNRENVQSKIEILAKLFVPDHLFKISVRGSHQPHIHALRACASQPLKLLLLDHAQQLGLQFQRNVTNFVEKERPPIRQLETADLLGNRTGKSAFLMTK